MPSATSTDELRFLIRPNRSLSCRAMAQVFSVAAVALLGIGAGFAAAGAWLVLPFAGLELLVLWLVFRWLRLHAGDYELLELDEDSVVVTVRRGADSRTDRLSRQWATVVESPSGGRWGGMRLLLRSHGEIIEVGRDLTDDDKRSLAAKLKTVVGLAYKSPFFP